MELSSQKLKKAWTREKQIPKVMITNIVGYNILVMITLLKKRTSYFKKEKKYYFQISMTMCHESKKGMVGHVTITI